MTTTDFTPTPSGALKPPGILVTFFSMIARHGATALAGALAGYGVIQGSQKQEFADVALSAAVWGLTVTWSWYEKSKATKVTNARVVAAAETGIVK